MSARWTRLDLPEPVLAIAALGVRVALGLADGMVLRSADGGASWVPGGRGPGPATALLPLAGAVLVGTASGLVRTDVAGEWQLGRGLPVSATVTSLAGQDAVAVAGTQGAGVYRSADGGVQWEPVGAGLPFGHRLHVYAAVAGPHGLVVAHALGVSRSGDGGRTWVSAEVGLPLQLPRVALAADGLMLYVGVGGRLYGAAVPQPDDVLAWVETYDGPGLGQPLDLLAVADGVLYAAVAEPPYLLHSGDGGVTWSAVGDGLGTPPAALGVAGTTLLALLPDGGLWRAARPPRPPSSARLRLGVEGAAGETFAVFLLDAAADVALTVHDVLDHEVARPLQGEVGAGAYRVQLPALEPGLYRCRLRAGGRSAASAVLYGIPADVAPRP